MNFPTFLKRASERHPDNWHHNQFERCPDLMSEKIRKHRADPRCIVDFGCGLGAKTIAMAMRHPNARVVGVDVTSAFKKARGISQKHLEGYWPDNLEFIQIEPGHAALVEIAPDVVYSWSVMEHVDRPILPHVLSDIARALTPGGLILTQIAPLYYSPFGSHLMEFCGEPWAHLIYSDRDFRNKLGVIESSSAPIVGTADWMYERYLELNRITAAELAQYLANTGLAIVSDQRKSSGKKPPAHLLTAFTKEALSVNELFFVHQRKGR